MLGAKFEALCCNCTVRRLVHRSGVLVSDQERIHAQEESAYCIDGSYRSASP